MREGNEGGQPGQAPEGGVPSVGPGRGGKPLTGVDGPMDGMDGGPTALPVGLQGAGIKEKGALELQRPRLQDRAEVAGSFLFGEGEESRRRTLLKRTWNRRKEKN